MDPTDIVLVPYDIHRLGIYVASVFFGTVACLLAAGSLPLTVLPTLVGLHWLQATGAFWIAAIVCGTPPTREVAHTGLACAYLATLVVMTSSGSSEASRQSQKEQQHCSWWQSRLALPLLPAKKKSTDATSTTLRLYFDAQFIATCQLHATVFVTILFQVLRLYDWGSQIQRWPLPMILGSTYGFVLGSLLGCSGVGILRCSPLMAGWYQIWTSDGSKRGTADNNKHQD